MEYPLLSLLLFLITILGFKWVFKCEDIIRKILYILIAVFIFIYSGIGVGYANKPYYEYSIYYSIYVIVLGYCLKTFAQRDVKINISDNINNFCERFGNLIIFGYILLCLMPLVQKGTLYRLLSPPPPSLIDYFSTIDFADNQVSNVFTSIENLIKPIFLIALYKYQKKPVLMAVFFLFPYYINYCDIAYMGRGMMAYLALFLILFVYVLYPKWRTIIVSSSIALIPSVLVFFTAYTAIRLGHTSDNSSVIDSFNYLIENESSYYKWYYDIKDSDGSYIFNYLIWFVTLPLPGFLKSFGVNVNFNALFTKDVLGLNSLSDIDSICLPGIVNESIFIFGNVFFFLHAILLALVVSITYNTLIKNPRNFIPLLYTVLMIAIQSPRAGTSGSFSGTVKLLFVYFLFYIFSNKQNITVNR